MLSNSFMAEKFQIIRACLPSSTLGVLVFTLTAERSVIYESHFSSDLILKLNKVW